jgi:hypothetical protein
MFFARLAELDFHEVEIKPRWVPSFREPPFMIRSKDGAHQHVGIHSILRMGEPGRKTNRKTAYFQYVHDVAYDALPLSDQYWTPEFVGHGILVRALPWTIGADDNLVESMNRILDTMSDEILHFVDVEYFLVNYLAGGSVDRLPLAVHYAETVPSELRSRILLKVLSTLSRGSEPERYVEQLKKSIARMKLSALPEEHKKTVQDTFTSYDRLIRKLRAGLTEVDAGMRDVTSEIQSMIDRLAAARAEIGV